MKGFESIEINLIILKLKILITVFPDYMENNKLKKCDSSFA